MHERLLICINNHQENKGEAMLIDHINLNTLRIFECVYRTKSMTQAATELHLTQSGVSQHIKHLEEILETKLFDRIKQRLIPTRPAETLFDKCSTSLYNIEQSLSEVKSSEKYLKGTISIGTPIEFGNNLVLPALAKIGKKYPNIDLKITYGFASEMNARLLTGELDFAFIDDYHMDSVVTTKVVYEEKLFLCAHPEYLKNKGEIKEDKKYFESLNYIAYMDDAPVLNMWFQDHYKFQRLNLEIKARLMDVEGVATLITNQYGVGVLPGHVLEKLKREGNDLYRFKPETATNNPISVAYINKRVESPVIAPILESIIDLLQTLNKNRV